VLEAGGSGTSSDAVIDAWCNRNGAAVERCLGMIADIKGSRAYDTTTLPVALREVRNLIRGRVPASGATGGESFTMAG
jgi:NAD-specific glutamate dehydrogenase